jgi:pimeloyl-ACP methyl ester carboxylesterase
MKHQTPFVILFLLLSLHGAETMQQTGPSREILDLDSDMRSKIGGAYVTLSGGVTHYELSGPADGDVVVLVHGANLSMWVWDRQVPALRQAGFRVLRYDHYGRGYSDTKAITFTIDLYRTQLLELLDTLGIQKPVHLIGHSFGGIVVSYFTSHYPARVKDVIYISPGVKFGTVLKTIMRSPVGKWFVHYNIEKLPKDIDEVLGRQNIPLDPYKDIYLEQILFQGFESSVYALFTDVLGDFRPSYRDVYTTKKRTMLMWGTSDNIATKGQMDMVRKAIPDIEYHALENVGHVPQFEATETCNNLILHFLDKK